VVEDDKRCDPVTDNVEFDEDDVDNVSTTIEGVDDDDEVGKNIS
jgi:hypothetical protein